MFSLEMIPFYMYPEFTPIGELVGAGDPETEEWRYYQRDGNNLVRQTTNSAAEITLAWAYSPDGAVLIGAKGPVTNLGCGDIYDWSTGLVYKDGRYFDPTLGIWLTILPLMLLWGAWQPLKQRQKRRAKDRIFLNLILVVLASGLFGCRPGEDPPPTPCPENTPISPQSKPSILVFSGSWGDPERINEPGPSPESQIPHFTEVATEAVPYPGSKKAQADNANDYDGDLLIIGYSSGADSALIYADKYMRMNPNKSERWEIIGMALLGPTMTGRMDDLGEQFLDDPWEDHGIMHWERILDELLIGQTNIYLLNDSRRRASFMDYNAPPSARGILKKEHRPRQQHFQPGTSGTGTNNSIAFRDEVLNWFGVTP
jgi:hypothetical protein